jgi:DNA-damage-inducible protein D
MSELIQFEGTHIRKIKHNDEWYFSIIDVIETLTNSTSPKTYWAKLKDRELKLAHQTFPFTERLKLTATDGRQRSTDCANVEGIFRIIMSIPSPKSEPFKLWLAEQGKRTIDEINDPELLSERQAEYYQLKGYSPEWIANRLKTINIRKELTDEWQKRGITEGKEFSILTATIAKGTFGLTPSEHAQLKNVEGKKLRDHMTPLELIFTALGEELTRLNTVNDNAEGFHENHESAQKGGFTAGEARKRVEEIEGKKVISPENFMHLKSVEKDKISE